MTSSDEDGSELNAANDDDNNPEDVATTLDREHDLVSVIVLKVDSSTQLSEMSRPLKLLKASKAEAMLHTMAITVLVL